MEIKVNKLNYNLFAGSTTCLFIMVFSQIYKIYKYSFAKYHGHPSWVVYLLRDTV